MHLFVFERPFRFARPGVIISRFVFGAVVAALPMAARAAETNAVPRPSAEQAAQLIEQVRRSGIAGDYYFEFELHELPRRGDERVFEGRLWGSHSEQGNLVRVELADADGKKHRLLVQGGERPAVWRAEGGPAQQLGAAQLFAPLIPGVEVTPFDLQMPFLFWPDVTFEGVAKVRGRDANAFLFRPPPALAAEHPELAGVRAYLDAQLNALVQTEQVDKNNRVTKTFALASLKTV